MAELNGKQQMMVINALLTDPYIFGRAKAALKPEYFMPPYDEAVKFMLDYSNQYNSVPPIEVIDASVQNNPKYTEQLLFQRIEGLEHDVGSEEFILETIDSFCRQRALNLAILEGYERISKGDMDTIADLIKEAQQVSIKKDYGVNVTTNELAGEVDDGGTYDEIMAKTEKEIGMIETGWKNFDNLIDGGFGWGQLIYIMSPSGGGKSLALANLGLNFALQGYNVLYFTFELAEQLVFKRIIAMGSDVPYKKINITNEKAKQSFMEKLNNTEFVGMYRCIDIPQKSTINDIDSRIRDLEMHYKRKFQIVILDYADLMGSRDRRVDPNNISLVGKAIAEDLRGWAKQRTKEQIPTLVLTASQVGKEAMSEMEFNMNDMAGSQWKINTADMIFSVRTNRSMRESGEYEIKVLKNRNGGAVDKTLRIKYNKETLKMFDDKLVSNSAVKEGNSIAISAGQNPNAVLGALVKMQENVAQQEAQQEADVVEEQKVPTLSDLINN